MLGLAVLALACGKSGSSGKGGTKKKAPVPAPDGVSVTCPAGTSQVHQGRMMWCEKAGGIKHGPRISWDEAGKVRLRGGFADGKVHGEQHHFNADGTKASVSRYDRGLQHGVQTWWYPNGVKSSESTYVSGRYHGTHTNYDEAGKPKEVNEYVHGTRVRAQRFADGKKVSDQRFEIWVPKGKAASAGHPSIPVAWQACKEHHECTLQATVCCACGANNYVGVHFLHSRAARAKIEPSCKHRRCPSQMCQRVGARCDDGRCVSAQ